MTPHTSSFQLGASDTVLLTVKVQLSRLGYDVGDADSAEFDRDLDSTIKHFQQFGRGLFSDGILGHQTFEQIELARHQPLGDRILRFDPVGYCPAVMTSPTLKASLSDLGLYAARASNSSSARDHGRSRP